MGQARRCTARLGFAALLLLGALLASAQTQQPARVEAVSVADGVWFAQGAAALGSSANRNFISNAAFVVTDDGVVVIDALGSPALAAELIAEIRRVTTQPIRFLIVTHFHADHIYGLQAFKAIGTTVIGHASGQDYLRSETALLRLQASRQDLFPWIDGTTRLVGADRWLEGQETLLRVGSSDFVIRRGGPAHTPEDLVIYAPKQRVLFAGDLVFRGRLPFVGQADSARWIESLARLIEFDPVLLVPGHGPVSTQTKDDLAATRDYLLYLRKTMGEAARNLEPFEEAYAKTDWSRFEKMPLFRAANRMNAYNTYLLLEQQGLK